MLKEICKSLNRKDCLMLTLVCKRFLNVIRKNVLNYKQKSIIPYEIYKFIEIFTNDNAQFCPFQTIQIDFRIFRPYQYTIVKNLNTNILSKLNTIISTNEIILHIITNIQPCTFDRVIRSLPTIQKLDWYFLPFKHFCKHSTNLHWFIILEVSKNINDVSLHLSANLKYYPNILELVYLNLTSNIKIKTCYMSLDNYFNLFDNKITKITKDITNFTCVVDKVDPFDFLNTILWKLNELEVELVNKRSEEMLIEKFLNLIVNCRILHIINIDSDNFKLRLNKNLNRIFIKIEPSIKIDYGNIIKLIKKYNLNKFYTKQTYNNDLIDLITKNCLCLEELKILL